MKNETPTPAAPGTLHLVPLAHIERSRTNPRTHFDDAKLAELADSIRAQGIVSPLLIRPLDLHLEPGKKGGAKVWFLLDRAGIKGAGQYTGPTWDFPTEKEAKAALAAGRFELVDGERRFRAATSIRLDAVPCIVRPMTAQQARAVQLLSFVRENISDLEAARSYQDLIAHHGYTAETLRAQLGLAKATFYARLTILKTTPAVQKALAAGTLTQSHAQLIAGVPLPLQDSLLAKQGEAYNQWTSVRELEEIIAEHYRRNLKEAPFDTDAAQLVKVAGTCAACPKRQAPGICTDVACYDAKIKAHFEARAEEAKKNGQTVLEEKRWNAVRHTGKFVELDQKCWDDNKGRTWRQLTAGSPTPATMAWEDGQLIAVMPKPEALAAAAKNGFKTERPSNDWERKQREESKRTKKLRDAKRAAVGPALDAIKRQAIVAKPDLEFWKLLLRLALHDIVNGQGTQEATLLATRRGLKPTGTAFDREQKALLAAVAAVKSEAEARAFLIETVACRHWLQFYNGTWGEQFQIIADHFGVDLKKLEAAAAAPAKPTPISSTGNTVKLRVPAAKAAKKGKVTK